MLDSLPSLNCRQRVALVIAIVASRLALGHVNLHARLWLRDDLLHGVPAWLDNMLLMIALMTLVCGAVGLLLLGPRRLGLGAPQRPREAWIAGALSGLGLVVLASAALALSAPLVFQVKPNWPMLAANLVSNFEEELISRGTILVLLVLAVGERLRWVALVISGALFCQGHAHYPLPLLSTVFIAGLVWSWMAVRYRSLWPGYLGHMVADVIGDTFIAF
jgi:membrane protease YdiL (CAAX protease family)